MANFTTPITLAKGVEWENGVRRAQYLLLLPQVLCRVGKQAR